MKLHITAIMGKAESFAMKEGNHKKIKEKIPCYSILASPVTCSRALNLRLNLSC